MYLIIDTAKFSYSHTPFFAVRLNIALLYGSPLALGQNVYALPLFV